VGGGKEGASTTLARKIKTRNTQMSPDGFIPTSSSLYRQLRILVMPYGKKISGSCGGVIAKVINP
jgi:hypothetical protein